MTNHHWIVDQCPQSSNRKFLTYWLTLGSDPEELKASGHYPDVVDGDDIKEAFRTLGQAREMGIGGQPQRSTLLLIHAMKSFVK